MKFDNYIGIDPDVTKSGVAFLETKSKKLELANLSFFQLFDYLKFVKQKYNFLNESVFIKIECGFLNKSNWHKVNSGSSALNSQIGQRTGANHEVAKKIVEMCQYLEFDYLEVKPTKSKVTHEYFKKLTGILTKTNQEQRDAGMLIWF